MLDILPLAFDRVDRDRTGVMVLGQLRAGRYLHQYDPFTPDRVKLEVLQQDIFRIGCKRYPRQRFAVDDRGIDVFVEHIRLQ